MIYRIYVKYINVICFTNIILKTINLSLVKTVTTLVADCMTMLLRAAENNSF